MAFPTARSTGLLANRLLSESGVAWKHAWFGARCPRFESSLSDFNVSNGGEVLASAGTADCYGGVAGLNIDAPFQGVASTTLGARRCEMRRDMGVSNEDTPVQSRGRTGSAHHFPTGCATWKDTFNGAEMVAFRRPMKAGDVVKNHRAGIKPGHSPVGNLKEGR